MKITNKQLRQIINEELNNVLNNQQKTLLEQQLEEGKWDGAPTVLFFAGLFASLGVDLADTISNADSRKVAQELNMQPDAVEKIQMKMKAEAEKFKKDIADHDRERKVQKDYNDSEEDINKAEFEDKMRKLGSEMGFDAEKYLK